MEGRTIWKAIQFRLGHLYFHDVEGSLIGFCCNEKVPNLPFTFIKHIFNTFSPYYIAMFFFFFFAIFSISLFYRISIIFAFAIVNLFENWIEKKKTTKLDSGSFYTIPFSFGSWLLRMLARPPWRATIKVMGSEYLEPDIPSHERFGAPSNLRVTAFPLLSPLLSFLFSSLRFHFRNKATSWHNFEREKLLKRSLCRTFNRSIRFKVNFN